MLINSLVNILNYFKSLEKNKRRTFLLIIDLLIIGLSVFLGFFITSSSGISKQYFWIFVTSIICGILINVLSGQYKGVTRYLGSIYFYKLVLTTFLLIVCINFIGFVLNFSLPLFSYWIVFFQCLIGLTIALRLILRDFLFFFKSSLARRVAIYGAGDAGAQLALLLKVNSKYILKFFIDDSMQLWGRNLNGIDIYPLRELIKRKGSIDLVILAIPSASSNRIKEITEDLSRQGIDVMKIPSIDEITSGKAKVDYLRPVDIHDLLGRKPVKPNEKLLSDSVYNLSVFVTGAGGSIGSELCRQIIRKKPKLLILFDSSEPSLYEIEKELSQYANKNIKLISVLGCAKNELLVKKIISNHDVDVIFHAAAYKHVPIVEENIIEGISNNAFSTLNICRSAKEFSVKKVILISTDKAVRPTNVMGATKRLAELIIQAFAKEQEKIDINSKIKFSIVRFGNVLGSSGSVVPLFKKQIAAGGPLTLTHKDITRFFMTIKESSQLVMQASSMSKGGELFLLDMGKPLKIIELADAMIRLSGLSVKSKENQKGDIEIKVIGLRPGEKLYEELLIDKKSLKTQHPLIFKADEKCLDPEYLFQRLEKLEENINNYDEVMSSKILKELVPEWFCSKSINNLKKKSG